MFHSLTLLSPVCPPHLPVRPPVLLSACARPPCPPSSLLHTDGPDEQFHNGHHFLRTDQLQGAQKKSTICLLHLQHAACYMHTACYMLHATCSSSDMRACSVLCPIRHRRSRQACILHDNDAQMWLENTFPSLQTIGVKGCAGTNGSATATATAAAAAAVGAAAAASGPYLSSAPCGSTETPRDSSAQRAPDPVRSLPPHHPASTSPSSPSVSLP